jgi:hypothetical protein
MSSTTCQSKSDSAKSRVPIFFSVHSSSGQLQNQQYMMMVTSDTDDGAGGLT